jgi:hypothetical protein
MFISERIPGVHMDAKRQRVEDVLAMRGSGWEGDLEQLRAGWSRTEGAPDDHAPSDGA